MRKKPNESFAKWQREAGSEDAWALRAALHQGSLDLCREQIRQLAAQVPSRPSPEDDSEVEVLLHRGMSATEFDAVVSGDFVVTTGASSWTPAFMAAGSFASRYAKKPAFSGWIVSAWFDAHGLQCVPFLDGGTNYYGDESEVIIKAGARGCVQALMTDDEFWAQNPGFGA